MHLFTFVWQTTAGNEWWMIALCNKWWVWIWHKRMLICWISDLPKTVRFWQHSYSNSATSLLITVSQVHCESDSISEIVWDRHSTLDSLLLDTSDGKCHVACRFVPLSVSLSFAFCKSFQMQFDEHLCSISHDFNWLGTSRSPSVTAATFR